MMNISLDLENKNMILVINGSSAGLTGDFIPPDNSLFDENTIFYDLNYSLTGTAFCNWAEEISAIIMMAWECLYHKLHFHLMNGLE